MAEVVEKIVRQRIYDSIYWKTSCYGVNAASICDRCADLTEIGGFYANYRPTAFLCLVLKLILVNPPREIINEMLNQRYFKYLTAVAAVFVRLKYDAMTVYRVLEPLLADYRKLRYISRDSTRKILHLDELIDLLLTEERVCDVTLPRIPPRVKLEAVGLEPRTPLIEEEEYDQEEDDEGRNNEN